MTFLMIWAHVGHVIFEQVHSVSEMIDLAILHAEMTSADLEDDEDAAEMQDKMHVGWAKATERVFKAYDLDSSGAIDFKELRSMLQQMYPKAPAPLLRQAMMEARQYMDADGEFDLATFQDAVSLIMEFMALQVRKGVHAATPHATHEKPKWYKFLRLDTITGTDHIPHHVFKKLFKDGQTVRSTQDHRLMNMVKSACSKRHGDAGTSTKPANLKASSATRQRRRSSIQKVHEAVPEVKRASLKYSSMSVNLPNIHGQAKTGGHAVSDGMPFDETQPSVVVVRTTGGGFLIGEIDGSNLPKDLSIKKDQLAATLIAMLISRGFTLIAQSTIAEHNGKNNLCFTLTRPGRHYTTNANQGVNDTFRTQAVSAEDGAKGVAQPLAV